MAAIHPARVVWEGARAFVHASTQDAYWWLGEMIGDYLGIIYQLKYAETRLRLLKEGAAVNQEVGAWRVRLQDLLDERPELTVVVRDLTTETVERLAR